MVKKIPDRENVNKYITKWLNCDFNDLRCENLTGENFINGVNEAIEENKMPAKMKSI